MYNAVQTNQIVNSVANRYDYNRLNGIFHCVTSALYIFQSMR